MNPTQTGIGVALALVVVMFFLVLPKFGVIGSSAPAAVGTASTTPITQGSSPTNATTTMPQVPALTQLQVQDEVVGTGSLAAAGDTVTVNYVGALIATQQVFDASANHGTGGFTFKLGAGQVIKGWDQGVVGMKVGGKRLLAIPASLAYGAVDYGPIPANSDLVFEVELLKVEKAAQ